MQIIYRENEAAGENRERYRGRTQRKIHCTILSRGTRVGGQGADTRVSKELRNRGSSPWTPPQE